MGLCRFTRCFSLSNGVVSTHLLHLQVNRYWLSKFYFLGKERSWWKTFSSVFLTVNKITTHFIFSLTTQTDPTFKVIITSHNTWINFKTSGSQRIQGPTWSLSFTTSCNDCWDALVVFSFSAATIKYVIVTTSEIKMHMEWDRRIFTASLHMYINVKWSIHFFKGKKRKRQEKRKRKKKKTTNGVFKSWFKFLVSK